MDIFADFAARVAAALKTLYPEASAELIARAVVEPPRDPADPIEVSIDPDHPENTRIVFHVRSAAPDDAPPPSTN